MDINSTKLELIPANTDAQFSSVTQSCSTLCDPMSRSTTGLPVYHQFPSPPKPTSVESVMPSNHLILCRPLLLPPSIFSSIRVFSNKSALCIRWPLYWNFSFNISPSSEHPELSCETPARSSPCYSPAEPRNTFPLICLILAS